MRRLDKAYDSLHALFGRAVVVAHLMEDLIASPRSDGIAAAAEVMSKHNIDIVGATDAHGAVVGVFSRAGFAALEDGDVMPANASLKDALVVLRERSRVFVRDAAGGDDARGRIVGIVTRADLQKPPFRLYCFGLVTLLEMHMLQLIRAHFGGDDDKALALLTAERAQKARAVFAKRKANGLDIGLADCLELADKREIIAKTKLLWESLGFSSVRALERSFKDVQQIRDDLAHGQLLDGGREWTDVIARMLEVEALLNATVAREPALP